VNKKLKTGGILVFNQKGRHSETKKSKRVPPFLLQIVLTIYEINSFFEKGLSLIYAASYGSIQNAIKKLLKNGLIEFEEIVEKGRNKKKYSLNERGRQTFFDWMLSEINTNKLETCMLSKIFFLGYVESLQERVTILNDMIDKVEADYHSLKEIETSVQPKSLPVESEAIVKYQMKTLEYGKLTHQTALKWLQRMKAEIQSQLKE